MHKPNLQMLKLTKYSVFANVVGSIRVNEIEETMICGDKILRDRNLNSSRTAILIVCEHGVSAAWIYLPNSCFKAMQSLRFQKTNIIMILVANQGSGHKLKEIKLCIVFRA